METETVIEMTCTQSNSDGSETTYIERKVKWHKEITGKVPKTPRSHVPTRSADHIPHTPINSLSDSLSPTSIAPTCNAPRYPPDVPHPKQITLPEDTPTPSKFYVITAGQEVRISFDWCIPVHQQSPWMTYIHTFICYLGMMPQYGLLMSVVQFIKATRCSKMLQSTTTRLTMLASCVWCPSLVGHSGRSHRVPREERM